MGFMLHESLPGGERGQRIAGDQPVQPYGLAPMKLPPPRLPSNGAGISAGQLAGPGGPPDPMDNDCAPPRPAPRAVDKTPFKVGGK
jgi:hypothetical protein